MLKVGVWHPFSKNQKNSTNTLCELDLDTLAMLPNPLIYIKTFYIEVDFFFNLPMFKRGGYKPQNNHRLSED